MKKQLQPLSILHLEDSETDAALIAHSVGTTIPHCTIERVATAEAYTEALSRGGFDLILSDYRLPMYDGDRALELARQLCPGIPFIMVTGELGEDRAIETLKRGATDYVLKDNLKRLIPAIRRAIEEAALIRQRQETEACLERERTLLQAIINGAKKSHLVYLDRDFNFVRVNDAYAKTCGYTPEEMIGKNHFALYPHKENEAIFARVRDTGIPVEYHDKPFVFPDQPERGMTFWDWTLEPIKDTSGMVQGLVFSLVETTEHQRLEEALRESQRHLAVIIDTAMDGIITLDEQQRIILFNKAAEAMFGYAASEVIRQPHVVLMPERFREQHYTHVKKFGDDKITTRSMGNLNPIITGLRKNGEEFPVEASISQIDMSGRKFFTVILRDVTERKRIEEERIRVNEQLEQRVRDRTIELEATNRELESFSYSVSHDLKAPLRAIQGFSKLLAEECSSKLSEDEQHYLNAIVQNTTNMNKLVEDLLTFSRLSKQTLVLQDIDMARLFRSVLNELQTIEPSYRRVDVVLVEPIPLINADPTLIRQVVINLLSNAFKFTRNAEHPRIEIGLQSCNSEHVFFIRDNGIGFDMQYAARLFGVFQRLHDVREYEGTGIGLANVKRIIERHGGRVWAEGKLEEGATVYFTLPMSAE